MRKLICLLPVLLLALLAGCATMNPDWEDPVVTVTSFRALPSEGMAPSFEVGLRIMNPNSADLKLDGIVYTISLEGKELIKGVGKDFPVIEGYTQEDVTITASVQLLAGLRLVSSLMQNRSESLDYEFEAKLDLAGMYPSIYVTESGEFNLAGSAQ